jgi:hypothetical protein
VPAGADGFRGQFEPDARPVPDNHDVLALFEVSLAGRSFFLLGVAASHDPATDPAEQPTRPAERDVQ